MTRDSSEYNNAFEDASKKHRHSDALARKARFFSIASRFFAVIASLGIVAALCIHFQEPISLSPDPWKNSEQLRAEALVESGRSMAAMTAAGVGVIGFLISMLLAGKWARATSESIANSESANQEVFRLVRSSAEPFALYLRGFEEEDRSQRDLLTMPISTKRPDKATRWIESEIVDELKRRNRTIFCIANPSDTFLLPGAIRLLANPDDWLAKVTELAHAAEIIVIYFSSNTPGLIAEIDLLRRENMMKKSVVVVRNRLLRQLVLPKGDFFTALAPPTFPILNLNQSAFGPIIGQRRFHRELESSIEKIIKT